MRRLKRTLWVLSFTFLALLSVGLAIYIPIYQEASDDAANIGTRLDGVRTSKPTVMLSADLQSNGQPKVLDSVAAVRRTVIDLTDKKYPSYIRYAIVAAEDRRFYDHRGVDPIGLARAAFTTVRDRHSTGGGSTISMQLAKLLINGDARTPMRKLKDIATAQQIENLKTKDEILNIYANYAFYGERAFGIQRAAEIYFGKDVSQLTVGEAAMLARSVRLPSRVNPVRSPEKMIPLRDYVLKVMLDEGWITQGQYNDGIREVPKLNPHPTYNKRKSPEGAGYFVDHVWAQLDEDFPGNDFRNGGYRIETTLNYKLQLKSVESVRKILRENRGHDVNDGAIVVMDQMGRILAEVGGPDYNRRQFNVITQGKRQPGSAFKAIVYATALRNGDIQFGDMLSNARIHLKDGSGYWDPQNASARENLPSYSLYSSFAYSINRPAIHTIMKPGVHEGPQHVIDTAKEIFGIKSRLLAVPSLALGSGEIRPLELLKAYGVFMLGGKRVEPKPIIHIYGPDGVAVDTGQYENKVVQTELTPEVARQMDELLKGPVNARGGTATWAQQVPNARGKTGTTNEAKDAWFCGYSDGLVGVGWVGNSNSKGQQRPMGSRVFGGTVTVKIWTEVMLAAHNMGLAKGVKGSPATTVGVSENPEPEVKPVQDGPPDGPKRDPNAAPPEPGPVIVNPDPASFPDSIPPPDDADGDDPPVAPPTDPVRTENPRRNDPPRRIEPQQEEAEVCVDTGLRASMYCPETVTKQFPKGRAPRRTCTLHHG